MNNIECFICLDEINEPYNINKDCSCILYLHEKCLFKWFAKHKECPICREKINIKYETTINIPEQTNYITQGIEISQNNEIPVLDESCILEKYKKKIVIISLIILVFLIIFFIMIYF